MALSKRRREIRTIALTTAASMIEDYVSGGVEPEDIGLSESELEILDVENKKVAANLRKIASKLNNSA